jgi:hypothetical protein
MIKQRAVVKCPRWNLKGKYVVLCRGEEMAFEKAAVELAVPVNSAIVPHIMQQQQRPAKPWAECACHRSAVAPDAKHTNRCIHPLPPPLFCVTSFSTRLMGTQIHVMFSLLWLEYANVVCFSCF